MTAPGYPFAAIVGQPQLRLALRLAAVDERLSVLLKGDKGSGKSMAARSLAGILPPGAPFVNVPIGATEDRLLGGLDLAQALEGQARLKRGLIHEADNGVLYIDEVNLLADALTDALLDVASSGRHYLERDGFSSSADANFILLGSMNIEEGSLRPQLLDRFALSLDVQAPIAAVDRALILDSRLRFDKEPAAFCAAFEEQQRVLRQTIIEARQRAKAIQPPKELLQEISQAVTDAGVQSLRADLAALRAAIAHAALNQRTEIDPQDVESVLPLVLHHRSKRDTGRPPMPSSDPQKPQGKERSDSDRTPSNTPDRVFAPEPLEAPELRPRFISDASRGRSAAVDANVAPRAGRPNASHVGALDVVASFTQSFRNTGAASLKSDHLVFRVSPATAGVRFIFVVDASGSQAAQQRMRAVKGAAGALLESSIDSKDEVAVISFRGPKAEIVLEPCRDAAAAHRILEFLPTGGRTPLAHALELAQSLVTANSVLILLTDGRANVSIAGADPFTEALDAARRLNCSSILVDSSIDPSATDAINALTSAMRGRSIRLDELSRETLLNIPPQ